MHMTLSQAKPEIFYPESDGEPMADNTRQFVWITVLFGNLAALFRGAAEVFVCGNQFWYPVEGEPKVVMSPDVYVVFGRPKGHRPSWKQWVEGGVPMTVVFEIISPSNDWPEMIDKYLFYDEHGVEEFYIFDPERNTLEVYVRGKATLKRIGFTGSFVSPRLGVRFDLTGPEMVVTAPDGRRFLTFEELEELTKEIERAPANKADERAEQSDEHARRSEDRAQKSEDRARRLGELSAKLLAGDATPADREELQRLVAESTTPTE